MRALARFISTQLLTQLYAFVACARAMRLRHLNSESCKYKYKLEIHEDEIRVQTCLRLER